MTPCFVYILHLHDGHLYVGCTDDLKRRTEEHRSRKGGRTTRLFGAGDVIYSEEFPTRAEAERREQQIKRWSRGKKLALAGGDREGLKSLSRCRAVAGNVKPQGSQRIQPG